MPSRASHDADRRKNCKKAVSFGGPGYNKTFGAIQKENKTPFFHEGATVLSQWNKYGTVREAFKEKEKVIVIVAYYARDIPSTWEIGGKNVPSLPQHTDPNSVIVIGHDSNKLKLVNP